MAPHAAALLEQTAYPFAQNGVLVPGPHGRALVVAGAATGRHGIERDLEAEPAPDPFHDPRLLPVRRPARVEARAAGFYNRDRPRHRVLQTQRGDLPFRPHRVVAPVVHRRNPYAVAHVHESADSFPSVRTGPLSHARLSLVKSAFLF